MASGADQTDATAADPVPGKKDSQLILRMNKAERDEFIALCQEQDSSAAREIRRFIRKFVKKNANG
jgi:hypothetical protein